MVLGNNRMVFIDGHVLFGNFTVKLVINCIPLNIVDKGLNCAAIGVTGHMLVHMSSIPVLHSLFDVLFSFSMLRRDNQLYLSLHFC